MCYRLSVCIQGKLHLCGFLVDPAHASCEAVYWLKMHLLLVLVTQKGFVSLLGYSKGAFQLPETLQ